MSHISKPYRIDPRDLTLDVVGSKNRLDSHFTKFAVYIINVNSGGKSWRIHRRFNQFCQLDSELRSLHANVKLPRLPRKHFFKSSTDEKIVEERIELLDKYLKQLSGIPSLMRSYTAAHWLSPQSNPGYVSFDDPDREGYLEKEGHVIRNWKQRWFLLKNDMLYYFRTAEEQAPLGVIPMNGATVTVSHDERGRTICIIPGSSQLSPFYLKSSSEDDHVGWLEALERAAEFTVLRKRSRTKSTPCITPKALRFPIQQKRQRRSSKQWATTPRGEESTSFEGTYSTSMVDLTASTPIPMHSVPLSSSRGSSGPYDVSPGGLSESASPGVPVMGSSAPTYGPKLSRVASASSLLESAESRSISPDKTSSAAEASLRKYRRARTDRQKLPRRELLGRTKDAVDMELEEYISQLNFAIVSQRFLRAKGSGTFQRLDASSGELDDSEQDSVLETLKDVASAIMHHTPEDLLRNDRYAEIVKQLQGFSNDHPEYREHAITLMFIFSPISRLAAFEKSSRDQRRKPALSRRSSLQESSPRKPAGQLRDYLRTSLTPGLDDVVPEGGAGSSQPQKLLLQKSIVHMLNFYGAAMGFSFAKTVEKRCMAPSSPLLRRINTRRRGSPRNKKSSPLGRDQIVDTSGQLVARRSSFRKVMSTGCVVDRDGQGDGGFVKRIKSNDDRGQEDTSDQAVERRVGPEGAGDELASPRRSVSDGALHDAEDSTGTANGDAQVVPDLIAGRVPSQSDDETCDTPSSSTTPSLSCTPEQVKRPKVPTLSLSVGGADPAGSVLEKKSMLPNLSLDISKLAKDDSVDELMVSESVDASNLQMYESTEVTVVCRICENEIRLEHVEQHNKFCAIAARCCRLRTEPVSQHLRRLLEELKGYLESSEGGVNTHYLHILANIMSKAITVCESVITKADADRLMSDMRVLIERNANNDDPSVLAFAWRAQKELRTHFSAEFRKQGLLTPRIRGLGAQSGSLEDYDDDSGFDGKKPKMSTVATIKDFEIIKPISRGAFGRVWLVRKRATGDLFAMKALKKADMIDKNLVDQVIIERNILAASENPYVVTLFYAFQNDKFLFYVMEYLYGGDCASMLEHVGYFEEDMARKYIAELIMALEYLHSLHIAHRDVKPDNLLITPTGHIKLTDFGLSQIGLLERHTTGSFMSQPEMLPVPKTDEPTPEPGTRGHRVVGTPDYLSPEALLGTSTGEDVDWWAVGVTLFEFLTGIPPFNADTPEQIFQNILNHNIPWDELEEDDMSLEARDLIQGLLCSEPTMRLTDVNKIKAHPFFNGIDWENLFMESREDLFIPKPSDELDTSYFERDKAHVSGESDALTDDEESDSSSSEDDEDDGEGSAEPRQKGLHPRRDQFENFSYKSLPSLSDLTIMNHEVLSPRLRGVTQSGSSTPSPLRPGLSPRAITFLNKRVESDPVVQVGESPLKERT